MAGSGNDIAVMVVDDSLVIRGLISKMIDATPGMSIVASIPNGEQAVNQIERIDPDVVVLDIEMPVMDGLTALPLLLKKKPKTKVIMASTLTTPNASASMKALALGAADYIPKPTSSSDISGVGGSDTFKRDLVAKVEALGIVARRQAGKPLDEGEKATIRTSPAAAGGGKNAKALIYTGNVVLRPEGTMRRRPKILAVGSSTGGPEALMTFFKALDKDIGIPVVLTQHMPPRFTTMLAEHITQKTGFKCTEASDGMALVANQILLAPGDYHMEVAGNEASAHVKLNQNPPENFCRPAVDPMLRSLVPIYGNRILSVILTGMGSDGLKGGKVLTEAGGEMVAQDEDTSVVWGMPGAVATGGLCTAVLPLDQLGGYVASRIKKAMP